MFDTEVFTQAFGATIPMRPCYAERVTALTSREVFVKVRPLDPRPLMSLSPQFLDCESQYLVDYELANYATYRP